MFDFAARPGLLFVWATLLPLASFTFLLLLGAVRNLARRYKSESGPAAQTFQLLGGDTPGKGSFYVATGAIGLAFVLSLIGFITYLGDHHTAHEIEHLERDLVRAVHDRDHPEGHGEQELNPAERKVRVAAAEQRIVKIKDEIAHHQGRWSGSVIWAQVLPKLFRENNPDQGTTLTVGFYIDGLSAIMFVMVTFIATLIHIFSSGYMAEELARTVEDHQVHTSHGHLHRRGRFGRFYLFLSLFCFSMLNLLLADNLFQVFVSWELVGVCSFLLIGFYYERQSASNAANKAFITNRVGDAGFIIGLVIIWTYIGTFNFQEIFGRVRAPAQMYVTENVVLPGHADAEPMTRKVVLGAGDQARILHGLPQKTDALLFRTEVLQPVDTKGEDNIFEVPLEGGRVFQVASAAEKLHRVRLEDVGEVFQVAASADKPTMASHVLLFPRRLAENRKISPIGEGEGSRTVAIRQSGQGYASMPYWMLVAAGLGIFLGCVGKSAQFPLHVWLPDAMEGPTPVSALIHAATMVAAGVYLVGRCFPLFTGEVLLVIAYTGGITLFVAATIAMVVTDIKKVLAYSTVSQLGYMMLGLGVGGWVAGLFHLVTHAFFKALMFLASGSVIYGCHHVQEMTQMGGLYRKMKITALTMLMGVLAIAGIPLFSGWYSKDAILASALGFAQANPVHYLLFLLPLATAGITTFYMFRMWFMTFTGPPRDHHVYDHAHESPRVMTVPLIILAVCAVGVGWGWPVWNAEASWLEHQIHHALPPSASAFAGTAVGTLADFATEARLAHDGHHLAGNLALGAVLIGLLFAALLYFFRVLDPAEGKEQFPGVYRFLANKWYFDELYSAMIVRPGLTVAGWCRSFDTRVIDGLVNSVGRVNLWFARVTGKADRGIVDGLVNLIARVSYGIGNGLRNFQTGFLRSYILFLVLAAIGIWVLLTLFLGGTAAGAP